jgi:serine/threonine protein kinase
MREFIEDKFVKIGEGSHGKVYYYKTKDTIIAIKKFKAKNFKHILELDISFRLNHDNLCHAFKLTIDKRIYMFMEYFEYTFYDHIKYGTPKTLDKMKLIHDVIRGLDFLHSHRIIHGDIKPQNIMIRDNHTAVIIDFGLSVLYEPCLIEKCFGTMPYIKPELIINPRLSYSQDWWALSVTGAEFILTRSYNKACSELYPDYKPELVNEKMSEVYLNCAESQLLNDLSKCDIEEVIKRHDITLLPGKEVVEDDINITNPEEVLTVLQKAYQLYPEKFSLIGHIIMISKKLGQTLTVDEAYTISQYVNAEYDSEIPPVLYNFLQLTDGVFLTNDTTDNTDLLLAPETYFSKLLIRRQNKM